MTSAPSHQSPEEEGSPLPALLAGGAIIVIFALIIFWPSGEEAVYQGPNGGVAAQQQSANQGSKPKASRRTARVEAREMDRPGVRSTGSKINPKIGPMVTGMAPPPPKEEIPELTSKTEEITYWERKLQVANRMLASRKVFVDRLNRISSEAESPAERENIESRRGTVEKNYEDARANVKKIEARLAELRGA